MNAAAVGLAALPVGWQSQSLRLLLEVALVVGGTAFVWHLARTRRRLVKNRLGERKRTTKFLVRERQLRSSAQQRSSNLGQRLINAHEEERRRLARELHDDITQRLARLAIDAAQAERRAPNAADSSSWGEMREQLARLSGDVHSLAYRLHPSILDELGLVEALRAECDQFSRRESIPVKVEWRDVPDEISDEVALCLFRVGQELLSNVARHAHASAVEVSLAGVDGGLQLAVHDNGIGFNPTEARERASLGLASMKERVSLVKGEIDCDSEPGHGAAIVAWVPVKQA